MATLITDSRCSKRVPDIFFLYSVVILTLVGMFLGCSSISGNGETEGDGEPAEEEVVNPLSPADCLRDPGCSQIMVAAHRGDHGEYPENSLAGLRSAASLGCAFVEVDVQHTADEVLVLMHDGEVDRTTDGRGRVTELTWEQIQALTLKMSNPEDPESVRIPRFSEALYLAQELEVMLYVDQKTNRGDLVLAEIQAGNYYDQALVRDEVEKLLPMVGQDERLLVMPPLASSITFDQILEQIPGVLIVEISNPTAWPELTTYIRERGVKVQQDVMAGGDLLALTGNYTGWKSFIEAGVNLPQTDLPELLVDAIRKYLETGIFPEEGPGMEWR
jgi:glycerophosphoryl diester phosphodiesterase